MIKNIKPHLFTVLISIIYLFSIFKENISSLFIIILCIIALIHQFKNNFNRFFKANLILTIPFWIILINTFIFSKLNSDFANVSHASLFLIMPIFLTFIPNCSFTFNKINFYFSVLKNVCLLIAIIYVVSFFWNIPAWQYNVVFDHNSRFRDYIYNDFKLFVIHPTYYTTILIFCATHSFDLVLREKKYLQLIYVFAFFTITLMLLTKLNLVLMIAELTLMIFIRSFYQIKAKIILAFSMLCLVCTFAFFTPGIKERFNEIYESFGVKPANAAYNSTNVRKAIFDSSIEIIKENWLTGVGFDNLQAKLNATYKANYDSSFFKEHNYMTHNYYFYILISSGIFGFLFYIFYLYNVIKISIKSNIFLFQLFVFNALIICFVEDYFFRQKGLLYFNLILMTFIKHIETAEKSREVSFGNNQYQNLGNY